MRHQHRRDPGARIRNAYFCAATTICLATLIACGSTDGVVVNDNGVSSGGVEIDTIEPALGPLDGGQTITVTGAGFTQSGTQVVIGESTAAAVVVNSASELTVRTPPGFNPATVDVLVFTSAGFASRIDGYDYNPRPTVTAVASKNGPADGGNQVTVSGTGFQALEAGTSVFNFGLYVATEATVTSDTSATVTVPPSATSFEIVDVAVSNNNGTSLEVGRYRYESPGMLATRSQFRTREVGELYFVSTTAEHEQYELRRPAMPRETRCSSRRWLWSRPLEPSTATTNKRCPF